MADDKNTEQNNPNQPRSMGAAAGAQAESSARQPDDVQTGRGGEQSDQISGETQKGAHNQETKNRNPQGNKPDRNQSARQKGNKL
jgi:hypothetical protein